MSVAYAAETVRSFESVEDLRNGMLAKADFAAVDLYPRDGSELLGAVEARVSELARVGEGEALVYSSGMAAVADAVDVALRATNSRDGLPILAVAEQSYTQTQRFINSYARQLCSKVVCFDSSSPAAFQRVIETHQPDVIISETIGNSYDVPVLDSSFALGYASGGKRPILVLDNTLPLSTAEPLGKHLQADDKVIVVESGTKSYAFNQELLGIAYTKNEELRTYLLAHRRTRGSLPGTGSLERIADLLPDDRDSFDDYNRRLFANTGAIALQLAANLPPEHTLHVAHPGLKQHDNHDLYSQRYPNHATPVFYLQPASGGRYELAERLWQHPEVRQQAQLGQSFGFDHARILPDENIEVVRIAGGTETDGEALGQALAEAIAG